jgi:menaquinone-9 beta-reductase
MGDHARVFSSMPKCDVAIVGGGPAGARAAYALARRGARVTLFDPSHPREKPCGGGVTGRALALVADAVDDRALPRCVIRSARFVDSARGESASIALDCDADDRRSGGGVGHATDAQPPPLVVASRSVFDAALVAAARRAGATVECVRVGNVDVRADGVRIETTAGTRRADIVIGADGANSLVRRRVARPFPRAQLSIATGFFAHGATSDEIVIELVADPPGYLWSFPRPDHLAIGVCAQADSGAAVGPLRARTAEWMARARLANGARLEPYAWPIPSLDARAFGALDLAAPRWALAGDAAGLVDPITREGIYFALLSGQWIADAVAAGRFPADYSARVRDEIGRDLACAARLKAGFFRPAFTGLLLHALRRSEAVRRIMVDLVAGRQSYRELKWRLLKTLELKLAWKVLAGSA